VATAEEQARIKALQTYNLTVCRNDEGLIEITTTTYDSERVKILLLPQEARSLVEMLEKNLQNPNAAAVTGIRNSAEANYDPRFKSIRFFDAHED
jgi:hypothetical protein